MELLTFLVPPIAVESLFWEVPLSYLHLAGVTLYKSDYLLLHLSLLVPVRGNDPEGGWGFLFFIFHVLLHQIFILMMLLCCRMCYNCRHLTLAQPNKTFPIREVGQHPSLHLPREHPMTGVTHPQLTSCHPPLGPCLTKNCLPWFEYMISM